MEQLRGTCTRLRGHRNELQDVAHDNATDGDCATIQERIFYRVYTWDSDDGGKHTTCRSVVVRVMIPPARRGKDLKRMMQVVGMQLEARMQLISGSHQAEEGLEKCKKEKEGQDTSGAPKRKNTSISDGNILDAELTFVRGKGLGLDIGAPEMRCSRHTHRLFVAVLLAVAAAASPIALVLDRKSLDEGQIMGVLQEGDVAGATLLEVPWVMLPEGSFVRHPKMRQGRIKLQRCGWLISKHPDYGELLQACSTEQVRKLFEEEAFSKLPLVKEAVAANRPLQLEEDIPPTGYRAASPAKPASATAVPAAMSTSAAQQAPNSWRQGRSEGSL
ncbi:unnamed protein product, partial [Effrenium voratum]